MPNGQEKITRVVKVRGENHQHHNKCQLSLRPVQKSPREQRDKGHGKTQSNWEDRVLACLYCNKISPSIFHTTDNL
jgi:hypothetical protein